MSLTLVLATTVAAPPEEVFAILTSTEGQQSFWTRDCDVSESHARFGFREAPVDLHVAVSCEPHTLVRMRVESGFPNWEDSVWEWELSPPDDARTDVLFRHYNFGAGYSESALGSTAQSWAMILDRLAKFVDTGVAQPFFS